LCGSPHNAINNSPSPLEFALAGGDLDVLGVDTAELRCLVVGQGIHGYLTNVEASCGVVNGKDVDGLAIVCDSVAGAALPERISDRTLGSAVSEVIPGVSSSPLRLDSLQYTGSLGWRLASASHIW